MSGFARRFGNARVALLMAPVAVTAALLIGHGSQAKDVKSLDAEDTSAERLVGEARQAEIAGDTEKCYRLLRDAVRVAPNFGLARWQLGQMEVDGEWLAIEEAQRRAAANPKQAQYRELRAQHGETPAGQLELARWCRKNKLDEEAQFHWASVLAVAPNNEEAQRALGVRWSNGRLLTRKQIAAEKEQLNQAKRAEKRWAPAITKWRKAIAGADAAARDAALAEIRDIKSTDAIPAIESFTLGSDSNRNKPAKEREPFSLAFMEALAKMPDPAATQSLVRHAVFSAFKNARITAIDCLKKRPVHEYVPMLVNGLSMPLESSFHVTTNIDGTVRYWHSLYREGQERDWSFDLSRSAIQRDIGSYHVRKDVYTGKVYEGPDAGAVVANAIRKANVASSYEKRFANHAVATEVQVAQINRTAEELNSLIIAVLTGTTGQELGDSPKPWWDWWQEQNEYYAADEKDVERHYDNDTDTYNYGGTRYTTFSTAPPPPPGKYSCFAKGTPVWTKTGQRAIETLEVGDLVLAQNVDTGELNYKPIIGRTVRPPSEILKLKLRGEEIQTTLGHPFWVAGVGWRMAKELEEGAILHGVTGSAQLGAVESAEQAEAYNLVVAEFSTYFVGESGLLVHDNTPRTPTRVTVPGVAKN